MFADAGATVSLAYVRHTHESEGRREQLAQDEAEQLLVRGARWLGLPDAERHVVLSASTGEGLWQLAEREQADLVIFGSDSHTAPGHVQPGRSALRLLEGGPVAVAIAPARLRDRADAAAGAHRAGRRRRRPRRAAHRRGAGQQRRHAAGLPPHRVAWTCW